MKYEDIITYLEAHADPDAVQGMAKVAITGQSVYGVSLPVLRALAKKIGKDHELALRLWQNNNRETRILAPMIDEPKRLTEKQMESWVLDFDSWEVCDQCCMNLFEKLPSIQLKAKEWAKQEEEFVKRTGFVLMARLAVSDKNAGDDLFNDFFPYIKEGTLDERNFVKKAVNWALRQIGKRNLALNKQAIEVAEELSTSSQKSARWVAADALRELKSPAVRDRLIKKAEKSRK